MGCCVALSVQQFPYHRSPWIRTGLIDFNTESGLSKRGITLSYSFIVNSSSSLHGPWTFSSSSSMRFIPRMKNSSQVSHQALSCGNGPIYVVIWNPYFPLGDTEFKCNRATLAVKLSRSGNSSVISLSEQSQRTLMTTACSTKKR